MCTLLVLMRTLTQVQLILALTRMATPAALLALLLERLELLEVDAPPNCSDHRPVLCADFVSPSRSHEVRLAHGCAEQIETQSKQQTPGSTGGHQRIPADTTTQDFVTRFLRSTSAALCHLRQSPGFVMSSFT